MHTVASLRKSLGLQTTNQVRNRIDAIKDVLIAQVRRGPNNQILVTDDGFEMLRQLQELYDSGLTINEASDVLRTKAYKKITTKSSVSSGLAAHGTKPNETASVVALLREEIAFLRNRIAFLETRQAGSSTVASTEARAWWEQLRGEIDGA